MKLVWIRYRLYFVKGLSDNFLIELKRLGIDKFLYVLLLMLGFKDILIASSVYFLVLERPFVFAFVFGDYYPLLILLIAALLGWHNKLISILSTFKLNWFLNL